ncbi:MAG TPA: HAD hydrolase-like protein, partial [Megamonas funiformis]|nr:HAD hydrolase-like protein [Megamonas funiformis]
MQYKYHNIIFDLDGTLINSGPGIIHAVQYALKKYGINETNMTVLKSFVGPPLNQQFINCYNFSYEQSLEAVKYFREYYTDKG